MVGAVKTDDLIMEEYYMELSMQYGYIRVSSKEQNEDRQYIAMSEFGIYHKNDAQCTLEKKIIYENACFFVKRWDAGMLAHLPENELRASLLGAKLILERFAS